MENPAADSELPQWRLDSVPRVAIGVLDGDPAYQLDDVRGSVLHGDRIVVANGGSRDLRVFDLGGRHIASGGRQGGGPGEFESVTWLAPFDGDSVILYDDELRRFSIFDLDARFGRTITPAEDFFDIAGRFADGSFLLPPVVTFSTSDQRRNGLVRDSSRLVRVSANGDQPDTLMVIIGPDIFLRATTSSVLARLAPFGRATRVAVGDSVFHTATSDDYEIRTWSPEGQLVRVLRRSIQPVQVSEAHIDRYKAQELESAGSDDRRRARAQMLAEMPYPDRMPAHGPMHVDDGGNLWVQDFSPWPEEPTEWTVFDPEGRAIGRVRLPKRFTLHQIGPDFVLGVLPDELDVQHVVIYGLARTRSREIVSADQPN